MRILLIFLLIFNAMGVGAQSLFDEAALYEWYERLYAFEAVNLSDKSLKNASLLEKDFAALNYHWWQLLSGEGTDKDANAISALSNRYLHNQARPADCSDQELFMAVISSSFEARVQMMGSKTLQSAQAYLSATPYLKMILQKKNRYHEFRLVANIYQSCYNEMEGRWLYLPFLVFLPDAKNESAFVNLLEFKGTNALCEVESVYFAYKIAANLKEDLTFAEQQISNLVNQYPQNLVLQMEKLKLLEKMDKLSKDTGLNLEKTIQESHRSPTVKAHFLQLLRSGQS